ncbi:dGTP triphosphohydrolase [Fluviicola sp.]|jgi:dGTPase|uniref:dGTP triphosphohydrolase n=1 Tax=Fluviicola sp. TaxID=1917219 RepID=UPI003D273DAD
MMKWSNLLNASRLRKSERTPDLRNDFESDFGRIIFSPAIRRMHDKTQVMPLTMDDHVHSRLTHSMEVMAIGHSLGLKLSENEEFLKKSLLNPNEILRQIPVLLKNACLVHDIGNPPFGHFGEESIQTFFNDFFDRDIYKLQLTDLEKEDFTNFDGNAQGFRILTKLQVLDDPYGLNLTNGSLATSLKYPNTGKINKDKLNLKKRGVFQSEKDFLTQIAESCGLIIRGEIVRHPLSFLMEAADSICYRVMDLEDGFNKGWYNFEFIEKYFEGLAVLQPAFERTKKKKSETSKIVSFRIDVIAILVDLAIHNFLKNYDEIITGEYHKELIHDDPNGLELKLCSFCIENIFVKNEIQSLELTGDTVLKGLLQKYIDYVFHKNSKYKKKAIGLISKSIIKAAELENNLPVGKSFDDLSDYYKLRVIVDFISGMTDQYALSHHQKLSGQKIN